MWNLYHVTPILNIDGIELKGLLPSMSQGRAHVVWMCSDKHLPWALSHIAVRRKLPVTDLMVCTCRMHEEELIRTRWTGVYQTRSIVLPTSYQSAETWLLRIERLGW